MEKEAELNKKIKRLHFKLRLKYPKFLLLILTFILAYFIFAGRNLGVVHSVLTSLGYFGAFITGIFYAYGFTAAPAAVILLILSKSQNILLTGMIAGFGSLFGDYLIFKLIRTSFNDEVNKLKKEKIIKRVNESLSLKFKYYLLMLVAEFFIASPLPDEIGVALLSMDKKISKRTFAILSYTLNTLGILLILFIGKII